MLTLLVLITGLRVGPVTGASESKPFHVLILSSYHRGYAWTEDIIAGIEDVFATYDQPVEFSYEYLDTKRYAETAAYYEQMAGVFEHKYRERPIDLLILSDNSAFDFVVAHQEQAFPGVPVVFCGINNYTPVMRERIPHSSGVAEFKEMDATLAVMLRLHPNIRTVAIISDVTGTGLIDADLIRKAVVEHGALDIVELSGGDLSFSELLLNLRQLPPDTGIFFSSFWRDRTGTSYAVEEILPLIIEAAEAPVYTHADTFVIGGVVGGVLVHGRTQGRLAGEIAVRILNGEPPAAIPVSYKANVPVFDYAALKRWRIDLHTLPPDALILNPPPPSFYEQHRTIVWVVIIVMTVLLTLVIGLAITVLSRRRAEAALRASEERYRSLIEHSNDAIYLLYDGRFDLINPRFAALFGVTPEEVRAPDFNFVSLVAPASRPLIEQRTRELQTGKATPARYEFTALTRTGQEIEVEVSVSYLAYRDGLATQGILRDISERKRAEEALAQSEQRFRDLIELAVDGILLGSPEGNITGANSRMLALLDIDAEALLGKHVREIFTPDSLQENPPSFDLLARGETVTNERIIQRADGTHVYVEMHSKQMPDGSYQSIVRDITERKQAEAALRFEHTQLLSIFDSIDELIYVSDPHTYEILFVNQKLRDILGEDVVGGICYQRFQGLDAPCPFCTNAIILQNKPAPYRWEYCNPLLNSDFVIVDRIITWPDGRDVRFELAVDITDRKVMETQLRRQEQLAAIGQLAAGIAHDFRNLLTTIILYAQLGQRQANLPPILTQYLETINREAHKATDLVQQILDFGRRVQIERRSLDLIPFVGNVIGVLQRTLPENIHIMFDVGTGPCSIEGDAGRLQQVLMNLALNARDAMPDGGTLRIGLTRLTIAPGATPPLAAMAQAAAPLAWIYLSVADTGTGMSEEAYAHRFEPFFTTKEPEQGTGLGLAQVYGIVQLHDGHIDVTTHKAKGTTFHIYLPAASTTAEETPPTSPPLPPGQGETLLLVEDNAQLRKASQSLLADLGYRVLTAANGREALALYETNSAIALLITDLVMPEMGGKVLLKALHSRAPNLKAVVMTGYTAEESETELRAIGFLEVIRKPLDAERLAGAVRHALDVE